MSRKTKIWLTIAAALVVAGLVLTAGAMASYNWDFHRLNTASYETNAHRISEEFRDLSIHTDTADLVFVPSTDGTCRVVCYEDAKQTHAVSVQNGTLTIRLVDDRAWFDKIGIVTETPIIKISLPSGEHGKLFIKESTGDIAISKDFQFESMDITTSTGDVTNYSSASETIKISTSTGYIRTENISADMLDLSVSTGNVTVSGAVCEGDIYIKVSTGKAYLTDIACRNLTTSGNTGDLSLNRVIAAGAFHIERTTGDVEFERCNAAEIYIQTDTGDVDGTLLSEKVFFITTDTGDVDVPRTMTGGRCEITTDTGDIEIDLLSDDK